MKDFYTEFDEEAAGIKMNLRDSEKAARETFNTNIPFEDFPLAMAYVPMQRFRQLYEPKEALENGTLFRELNLPFLGYKKKRGL